MDPRLRGGDKPSRRIVIFSTAYHPLVGGAEVAMKEATDRMEGYDFHMICAAIKPGLKRVEKIGNITVHRCGIGKSFDKMFLPIGGAVKGWWLMRKEKSPVVWSLMASWGGFAALAFTWLRPGAKLLLTLQEGDPLEHYAKRAGKLQFLHEKIFKRADAVQAISNFLADWAIKMGFRGNPEVVPNGVDLVKFSRDSVGANNHSPRIVSRQSLRASWGFKDDDVVLVTASRLSLKNGIDDLIRALSYLPQNFKALIAGDGEDKDKLHVLAEQKGLKERVVFLGSRSHDDLPAILQSSDIFVRASLSEGLGNAFLEAMAAGLPIIGTPVGGIPDFLTDGETGVFCKPRDPESIAAAAKRIQEEAGLKEGLIGQGEALVKEKYGWDGIARRIDGMLRSLSD